jgi:hypothetical protein
MKARTTKHLKGQRKFDLVVAKEIVCMLASSSSNGSTRGVAKVCVWINARYKRPWGDNYNWTPKDFFGLHGGELNVQMLYLNP